MKKILHICIVFAVFSIILNSAGCDGDDTDTPLSAVDHGCEWAQTLPESRPADFDLQFRYGYGGIWINDDILNTFTGTYTKDLGSDPSVTVNFTLTDEDLDRIYEKMVAIDFFCYPDEFVIPIGKGEVVTSNSNYYGYYFRVKCDGEVKELGWKDDIQKYDEDARNLRKVISLIKSIIRSKDEYWDLPSSTGVHI